MKVCGGGKVKLNAEISILFHSTHAFAAPPMIQVPYVKVRAKIKNNIYFLRVFIRSSSDILQKIIKKTPQTRNWK